MWARWEERFKMFGANRVNFTTTAWGGNKADSNNTIKILADYQRGNG